MPGESASAAQSDASAIWDVALFGAVLMNPGILVPVVVAQTVRGGWAAMASVGAGP
jgi:hypothetical protein